MDSSSYDYSTFVAIYLGVLGFSFLIGIASYVLQSIALMSFFRKVGVEPWAGWIPIYQFWKVLEVGGYQGWFALLLLVPGANYVALVFIFIAMYRIGLAFRKDGVFVVLGIFLPFVWAFILGGRRSTYEPQLLAGHGYPPPLTGFGSLPFEQRAAYGYGVPQQQHAPQQPPQPPYPGA